jgi:hypothetical protein
VIERERLPPLQVRNQGMPPLMPTIELFGEFGERLAIGRPKKLRRISGRGRWCRRRGEERERRKGRGRRGEETGRMDIGNSL